MSSRPRISPEKRAEILRRIKEEGAVANQVAIEQGVNAKTIYGWLAKEGRATGISWPEYSRLKRENEQLKSLVGELTLSMKRTKKI